MRKCMKKIPPKKTDFDFAKSMFVFKVYTIGTVDYNILSIFT